MHPVNISCKEANAIDLTDYLKTLGHLPQRISKQDYWYLSPLREEKTPSFKVNSIKNVWYDFGLGKGGTLIDFGKLYFQCTVKELLSRLENEKGSTVFLHPPKNIVAGERKEPAKETGKITIISASEITDPTLRNYLHSRKIPLVIADRFCSQVAFELNGKKHLAIGFKNDNGGYELRNYYFKGSSTPKEPKLIIQKDAKDLAVFEGFFSFLSYQAEQYKRDHNIVHLPALQANSLVLNSVAFFEKYREVMEKHEAIHLFLDNDKTGKQCVQKALQWSAKYKDQSHHYKNHKDLNESLIQSVSQELKQSKRHSLRR